MAKRKEGIQGKVLNLLILLFFDSFHQQAVYSQISDEFRRERFRCTRRFIFFHLCEIRQFLRTYLEQKALAEIYNENIVIKRL